MKDIQIPAGILTVDILNGLLKESQPGDRFCCLHASSFSGEFTFPADRGLFFGEEGCITLDVDSALRIACVPEAENQQIFAGEGVPQISAVMEGNPFWFGAKGDGFTDDTDAFKQTWKVFSQITLPYTEGGYVITHLNTFPNMILRGDSQHHPFFRASCTCDEMFHVIEGKFSICHICFDMSQAPDGSTVFFFDTAAQMVRDVTITHCEFLDAYHVFTDAQDKHVMMFMHFEDILCKDSRHSTFDIEDFEGFIFLKRFVVDNSASFRKHGLKEGFAAIDIDDVRGTIFEEMTVIGSNSGDPKEIGFLIPGSVALMASLWWDRVTVKDMGGYGIVFGNTVICSLLHTQILHCGGGILMERSWELQADDLLIDAMGCKASGTHGIHMSDTRFTHLLNVICRGQSGNGIFFERVALSTVKDCVLEDNEGYGYVDADGTKNLFSDCTVNQNKKGDTP